MPLDALTTLAFSMQAAPGTYALLVGSGVSSAAGIPTGWAIVLDLIRRVASAQDGVITDDPERWYLQHFREVPRYSSLLDQLAKTQSERQNIVRRYVEPTEEERHAGQKTPTPAHHAIARLAAGGYVRVILTTNFDRLIEQALDQVGLPHDVLDDADALAGSKPLAHTRLVVVKVNGDYRDTRIRNTVEELDEYPPGMNAFLDRVFDEFGLVVCGWSAEWDGALRSAIKRQASRRFSTFWFGRGELSDHARDLIKRRDALLVSGADANWFFTQLEGKVAALAQANQPHPLTREIAVAELKRYLPDHTYRIRLADLVMGEADRAADHIRPELFPADGPHTYEDTQQRVARYQAAVETLRAMLAAGSWHSGDVSQDRLFSRAIERLTDFPDGESGLSRNIGLRRYPALLCLYAAGVAALGAEHWRTLRELLMGREVPAPRGGKVPMVGGVHPWAAFNDVDEVVLHPSRAGARDKLKTPDSDHLRAVSRELMQPLLAGPAYDETFDRFEFLLGMILFDLRQRHGAKPYVVDGYVGAFAWRYQSGDRPGPWDWVTSAAHLLLEAGFFDGDRGRLEAGQHQILELARGRSARWW